MTEKRDRTTIPDKIISSKIYLIRDKKIMLDKDLALLYGVTTGNLNKAVKRNISRFPEDFMFRLRKDEFDDLIFQIGVADELLHMHLPNLGSSNVVRGAIY